MFFDTGIINIENTWISLKNDENEGLLNKVGDVTDTLRNVPVYNKVYQTSNVTISNISMDITNLQSTSFVDVLSSLVSSRSIFWLCCIGGGISH